MNAVPLALEPTRRRSIERALFASALLGFGYFHQGGGWNQNARFAMVRAMAEEGRADLDGHLVYASDPPGSRRLRRLPVSNGEVIYEGRRFSLSWSDPAAGRLVPVAEKASAEATPVGLQSVAVSGDVAFAAGRFYPNKAPGTAFLALAPYALLYWSETALGLDPDDWGTLTLNAWLTSALSVGLVSALGAVVFFRAALALSGGRAAPALRATLAFAFGTLFFPYATMLYEHDVVAVCLLAAFWKLHQERAGQVGGGALLGGLFAGLAVLCSYTAAPAAGLLGLYALRGAPRLGRGLRFALGAASPLACLGAYHLACFGGLLTTAYAGQNPVLVSRGPAVLGMLQLPRAELLPVLLLSPNRGLLFGAPVLAVGLLGLARLASEPRTRAEGWLFAGICASFLAANMSYWGWWGGWAAGPRYLVPALPFLALPLVRVRWPAATAVLGGVSFASMLLVTAVDPQPPIGDESYAALPFRPIWRRSPILEYVLPLFLGSAPEALLRDREESALRRAPNHEARERIRRAIAARDAGVFPVFAIEGPVSAGRIGIYEADIDRVFPPRSPEGVWNSFNLGELVFPRGRASLLPLLAAWAALLAPALRSARRV